MNGIRKRLILNTTTTSEYFSMNAKCGGCSLGSNVGYEQDGKGGKFARPVLIFKKFNKEVFWALPLSTRIKKGKFYAPLDMQDDLPRVVIISQLRLIDGKRLIDKIGVIDETNYKNIQKAVINLCNL